MLTIVSVLLLISLTEYTSAQFGGLGFFERVPCRPMAIPMMTGRGAVPTPQPLAPLPHLPPQIPPQPLTPQISNYMSHQAQIFPMLARGKRQVGLSQPQHNPLAHRSLMNSMSLMNPFMLNAMDMSDNLGCWCRSMMDCFDNHGRPYQSLSCMRPSSSAMMMQMMYMGDGPTVCCCNQYAL